MTRQTLPETRTVDYRGLLGNGRSFAVPPYQRDYSWTSENWSDLWDDLLVLRESLDECHYMGFVVVRAGSDRSFSVLDGQQRLVTLALFALAVIRRLSEFAEDGIEPEVNRARAEALLRRFVTEIDPASLLETSRLSLNETDDGFFQDLVRRRSPPNPKALAPSHDRMWKCYCYFLERLRPPGQERSGGAALVDLMQRTVARQLVFLLVAVDDDLDAYAVFERHDARGTGLTMTDLLKNYLFSRIPSKADRAVLRERWQAIVGTVRAERFPAFLRSHHIGSHTKTRGSHLFEIMREQVRNRPQVFELLDRLERRAPVFSAKETGNRP